MLNLLKIEFKKILPFRTFWMMLGLFAIIVPSVFYAFGKVPVLGPMVYNFPKVWHNLSYLASWLNLLLGVLVIMLVTNEFSFRTFRQYVIDGRKRSDFILSKVLLILTLALVCLLYLWLVGTIFGLIKSYVEFSDLYVGTHFLLIYCLQAVAYMSFALLVAMIVRTGSLSITIFLCAVIIEEILQMFTPDHIDRFFPLDILRNLIPNPMAETISEVAKSEGLLLGPSLDQPILIMMAAAYTVLFWLLAVALASYRDLK